MTEPFQITPELVTKLHAVLDHGLVKGVGVQEPGKMCVEAGHAALRAAAITGA
jgi:hypothetical protein